LYVRVTETTSDHSSLTGTHQRWPLDIYQQVFVFVLKSAADNKLLAGKTATVGGIVDNRVAGLRPRPVAGGRGDHWRDEVSIRALAAVRAWLTAI
jgi:hypothetical protein